jgi:type III secretory pathway component EscS
MGIAYTYHALIEWLGRITGMDDATLHFNVGLVILFAARMVTRRRLETMIPLLTVIAMEGANEVMDRVYFGAWRWDHTLLDIFHTLLWPAALSCAAWIRSRFPTLTKHQNGRNLTTSTCN